MKFAIEIVGDVPDMMLSEWRAGERAVSSAMAAAGVRLKDNWRGQIVKALVSQKLAKSIRSNSYPQGQPSINAAALVYSKAPEIISAHEEGALIRSHDGFWLAIPAKGAGRGSRGRKITPYEWEKRTGRRLRFIYWGGRIAKLVDDGSRNFRRPGDSLGWTNKGAGARTKKKSKLIFMLVPQAKLRKKLNLLAAAEPVAASIPADIVTRWRVSR